MKIYINGEAQETGKRTLAELCEALGYSDAKVATAINGEFVPKTARHEVILTQNDKIEILSPRQGG